MAKGIGTARMTGSQGAVECVLRQRQHEDNVVAATEKVVQKLHDPVEPVKE